MYLCYHDLHNKYEYGGAGNVTGPNKTCNHVLYLCKTPLPPAMTALTFRPITFYIRPIRPSPNTGQLEIVSHLLVDGGQQPGPSGLQGSLSTASDPGTSDDNDDLVGVQYCHCEGNVNVV